MDSILFGIIIQVLLFFTILLSSPQEVKDIKLIYETSVQESELEGIYFGDIRDAVLTNDDKILFVSSQNIIFIYGGNGDFITKLGGTGRGPGELLIPMSVATSPNGDIFVADLGNAKISIWNKEYQLIEELESLSPTGWFAHNRSFQTDGKNIFFWTLQSNPAISVDKVHIYKFDSESRKANLFYTLNDASTDVIYEFISGWGSWDISAKGKIVVSGKTPDYTIYKFGIENGLMGSFGNPLMPITRTKEEIEKRLELANRISEDAASLITIANPDKPLFHNIQLDKKNFVWAHRSKEYGSEENIDIYTLSGDYLTTVILPSSTKEYRLMDINGNKALFRVVDADGQQSMEIYQIEYKYS